MVAAIAVSLGDPSGIGPEIVLRLLEEPRTARLVVFGERRFLDAAASALKRDLPPLESLDAASLPEALPSGDAHVLVEIPSDAPIAPGKPSSQSGGASFRYVAAASSCVIEDRCNALLTMPVSKAAWHLAGHDFPGQTEFLGSSCSAHPVMMLAASGLRIALVTTHLALRDVPQALTAPSIITVCRIVSAALLRDLGIPRPRIAVMGLNPHASEQGRFGDEEARIIAPAIQSLQSEGVEASGPLPPDTAPNLMLEGAFDAIVAMYHEQAALPVKTLAFHSGVNVTLGLPIIRTSPDHGTAFNIAGKGLARPDSSLAALDLALSCVRHRASKPQ